MLSKIREKATGIFAWVIVIIITIPFALWGINSYFEGGGDSLVASVEGVDIDVNDFQSALAERRRIMAQVLQQNVGADFFQSEAFRGQVLDGLIQNAAEASYAERSGYRIGDTILGQSIRELPYFQNDGEFDPQRYQDLVANAGMSVARFEQQQRQQMISDQIRSAFLDSAFVSEAEVDRALALLEQTRTADYAVIAANDPTLEAKVDENTVRAHYEANREAYFAPEQMRVNFLVLSVQNIAGGIEVGEEEARLYYETNAGRYGSPEERRVSHVLIALSPDAGEEEERAALDEARALAERARAGDDFAELARTRSDDTGSASKGGDLGVISRGAMVKPFEDAAFALSGAGDVSDPVRSRFGYHVIKLTELQPARVKPFEDVRDEIEDQIASQLAESRYLELAETFTTVVYEQPDSLQPAADELQLEIQTSDWFSREQGDGLAANERFRNVSFSEEVRADGLNSEAFELDANTMVAVHRLDVRDRRQLLLEEVGDDIRRQLERQARSDAARELGESLLADVESGSDWDRMMEDRGLSTVEFSGTRDAAADAVERELVREIFAATTSPEDGLVTGGFSASSGDYVIYRLTEIADADPAEVAQSRREAVRAQLKARQSEELYLSFQQALRDAAEVTIFDQQLSVQ